MSNPFIGWKEIKYRIGIEFAPADFITHCNYVKYLRNLSDGLSVKINQNIKNKIREDKNLKKKITLINLTLDSIKGEYQKILKHEDFARLCVSWISVKSYYLIFNLLLIIKYLITADSRSFNSSHEEIINYIKNCINNGDLEFNKAEFNGILCCKDAMSLKFKIGSNVKIINSDDKERFLQILKKLTDYKLQDFKRKEKIDNFRLKCNRQKKDNYLTNSNVNICEFFYWYRIKANYRDLEFLNKDINSQEFKDYYVYYYDLTMSFYQCLKKLINDLAQIRFNKKIID